MARRSVVVILLLAAASVSAPLIAHHAAAEYDESQSLTIEGNLIDFAFRGPHTYLNVQAPDPISHRRARWSVEWSSMVGPLKAGDRVIITGAPGRNAAEHRLRLKKIVRSKDGWTWEGTS